MAWRGLNEELLKLLDDNRIPWVEVDDRVQRLALEVSALTRLQRLQDAAARLREAQTICGATHSIECGLVLRSQGILELDKGQTAQAKRSFLQSMEFGRANQDGMLEASALLNLGRIASEEEHHDEALEYYRQSAANARELDANDLLLIALGNEGYEQYALGNPEKALEIYARAEERAASLGDLGHRSLLLADEALAYADSGQLALAERADKRAIQLAGKIGNQQTVIGAAMDLAQLYIRLNRPDEAERYFRQARSMLGETASPADLLTCDLMEGEANRLRRDYARSQPLLKKVANSADSLPSMRWQAEQALGRMYEAQGNFLSAQLSYEAALGFVEAARADLKQEVSQLTFLENASSIYDDYIHLLVSEGKTQEALEAADWSRARTLQQGLGSIPTSAPNSHTHANSAATRFTAAPKLKASEIARKANTTLLFYWLGEKQSYLWAVSPEETRLISLPPKSKVLPAIERYRRAILALKDPLRAEAGEAATDSAGLYQTLIAPAANHLRPSRPVVLFVDGELGQLNFETLLAPSPSPHFWIEDATVLSAPSIRMFAAATQKQPPPQRRAERMLLFGDVVSPSPEFPALPMATQEMTTVEGYFSGDGKVYQGSAATPTAYLASNPEHFDYIHFVAHGTASRTDPLDSAVILSQIPSRGALPQDGSADGYKLYARDILRHHIDARLVTISACNSSGSKSFAGEGLVGLSWAFLRAGAHNAIGSLWEVSDASTPELMDRLYAGLQRGEPPATALRSAKLALIHSGGHFSRPFYWAPFQLYAGR